MLPGFDTAYNTRLIVVSTLAIALLAGWGLADLVERVERPRLLAVGALAAFALPVLAVLVARSPGDARFGDALRVAWGFAQAAADTGGAQRAAVGRAARVAGTRRRGGGAAGGPRERAARRQGVRRGGARAGRARPLPDRDGQQPRDPPRPRAAAGHAGDRAAAGAAPGALRGAAAAERPAAAGAGPGDALRPLRRARLRLPGRAPLRPAVAAHGRRQGGLHAADHAGRSDRRGAAHARAARASATCSSRRARRAARGCA